MNLHQITSLSNCVPMALCAFFYYRYIKSYYTYLSLSLHRTNHILHLRVLSTHNSAYLRGDALKGFDE